MTPSKETLEAKAKQFANIVFAIGAGALILTAFLLRPLAVSWMGEAIGENITFIVATIGIFLLSSERPQLALFATERQCQKYGHVRRDGNPVCERCYQTLAE